MTSRTRSLVALAVIPTALLLLASPGSPRPVENDSPPGLRTDEFAGWWHDAGNLLLHVSNRARFGRAGADATAPSAEWPAGSNHEYLYGAGLWVGGIVGSDTLVTAGLFQVGEFYNLEDDGCGNPVQGICVTAEGAPSGMRLFDDDGDGEVDEDPLDGADNDFDGLVDEDFAAISNQMYRTAFFDSSTFFNQFYPDPADHHHPLGLAVTQESYVWTHPDLDDFVGVEFRIRNASRDLDGVGWAIDNVYVGMMVDGDVGYDDNSISPWNDDWGAYVELDSTLSAALGGPTSVSLHMGYMYDGSSNSADDVPGYLGVMPLGGVHVYRLWSSGADDPHDDAERYRFLRGQSDNAQTIDPPANREDDWRYLVSAGPFGSLAPDSTIVVPVAFVAGDMVAAPGSGARGGGPVPDLSNPIRAQRVYDGFVDPETGEVVHWAGSHPPVGPTFVATAGNGSAVVEWDEFPESVPDPITGDLDFAGYRVERAGPFTGSGAPPADSWGVVAAWDTSGLGDIDTGTPGVGRYRWVDRGLRNFRSYWFRVRTWDRDGWSSGTGSAVRVTPQAISVPMTEEIRVQPNPWRSHVDASSPVRFQGVPPNATIRIHAVSGRVVATLEPGRTEWAPAASGVYLWRVSSPDGSSRTGKLVVVR